MHRPPRSPARAGTILIIVAGISALLATLVLGFLMRMRSDIEESRLVMQHAQAKLMLAAACSYVQECSRLGWDRWGTSQRSALPTTGEPIHDEGFGWIDVRHGGIGPNDRFGRPVGGIGDWSSPPEDRVTGQPRWPAVGGIARCPMQVRQVTPYAITPVMAYNPIGFDLPTSHADYGMPLLRHPDPQPVGDATTTGNGWRSATGGGSSGVSAANYGAWEVGDRRVRQATAGKSWFRVRREEPAVFVLTCGSGGSEGFRSWDEVVRAGEEQRFGDRMLFEQLRVSELRLWYRIEWSAAITEAIDRTILFERAAWNKPFAQGHQHYLTTPPNNTLVPLQESGMTQNWLKNPVGTIRWVSRLVTEPSLW
jgi:hypothetical protein